MASEEIPFSIALTGRPNELEGNTEMDVLIKLNTDATGQRTPAHICCVVDISGSMGSPATVKNEQGQSESNGLNLLDITKHAVKAVGHTLTEHDKLSLVKFDDRSEIVMEGVVMNEAGKNELNQVLDGLRRRGQTNIWDGLYQGLECARRVFEQESHYYSAVMLLTDGAPNVRPPRGEVKMLENYQDQFPNMRCVINTFGFGYNLDSKLLRNLASAGQGTFAFIPDPTIVGTVFVNMLSNSLATFATNVKIKLEPQNGAELTKVYGSKHYVTTWGVQIDMDSVNYGQSRDAVVCLTFPNGYVDGTNYLDATVEYVGHGETGAKSQSVSLEVIENDSVSVAMEKYRLLFCEKVNTAMELVVRETTANNRRFNWGDLGQAQQLIEEYIDLLQSSDVATEQFIQDILEDLTGQVREAFSLQEYFSKWGVHYLPSLVGAHLQQECNNFKDPGVQHYGGELFKAIQDEADKKFLELPPPTPTGNERGGRGGRFSSSGVRGGGRFSSSGVRGGRKKKSKTRSAQPALNMDSYHHCGNICFGGNSDVTLADGSVKKVRDIKQGDVVLTKNLDAAEVRCVVKTVINDVTPLATFPGGLKITPFHPIVYHGTWVFPNDVAPVQYEQTDAIYNFVLTNGHTMYINGVKTCTLGHGITENEVIAHAYFGTQQIVNDLQEMQGWNSGLITIQDNSMVRNDNTKLLTGFKSGCEILVSA